MSNTEYKLSDTIDIITEVLESGGEFRLYPKGTSMLPLLRQGKDSVVLIRAEDNIKKHTVAFYQRKDGSYILHRIIKRDDDGTYVMCGDNQTELETGVEPTQIIGCVSEIYRGKKPVVKSPIYKLYVIVWCFMPYRRAERGIRHLLGNIKRKLIKK